MLTNENDKFIYRLLITVSILWIISMILLVCSGKCDAERITVDILQSYIGIINPYLKTETRYKIAKSIERNCIEENVNIALITAMIENESSFYPTAISKVGAKGLMQIYTLECNTIPLNERKLFEIDYNIQCGICILKDKLRMANGNHYEAVKLYCGAGPVAERYAAKVFSSIMRIDKYIQSLRMRI